MSELPFLLQKQRLSEPTDPRKGKTLTWSVGPASRVPTFLVPYPQIRIGLSSCNATLSVYFLAEAEYPTYWFSFLAYLDADLSLAFPTYDLAYRELSLTLLASASSYYFLSRKRTWTHFHSTYCQTRLAFLKALSPHFCHPMVYPILLTLFIKKVNKRYNCTQTKTRKLLQERKQLHSKKEL